MSGYAFTVLLSQIFWFYQFCYVQESELGGEGEKECSAAKWHVLFLLQFHFDAKFMTTVKQLEMLNENEEEEGKKVTTFLTRWFVFAFVLFDTDSLFAFSPIYKQIQAACLKRKL